MVLRPGFEPTDELRLELIGFGRKRLGAAVAPKEIDFRDELPEDAQRQDHATIAARRELGLPEGDLSMLESES